MIRPTNTFLPLLLNSGIALFATLPALSQGYGGYQQNPYGQQGYPQGYSQGYAPAAPQQTAQRAQQSITPKQWFTAYDQIRRQAQMTPSERQQADGLLAMGFSCLVPGDQKNQAQMLLTRLVNRYVQAQQQMKQLPVIAETQALHQGYYQYFATAGQLFSDYLKVQDDIFAQDGAGTPIATKLMERKQGLETLNQSIQGLDGQLRAKHGVAAYHYQ